MKSNNWGYEEFANDIKSVFDNLFKSKGFESTNKTDHVSYAEFKNKSIGLYFNYDDSKALLFQFKKYSSLFEYDEYNLEECCLIKGIDYKTPICNFKDQNCIKEGLNYIKKILEENFEEELSGKFPYKNEHDLLLEEKYYLNKKIMYLPLKDELKQRIRKIYTPNAGVEEMRNRLIRNNEYPQEFKSIYDKYINK